VQRSSVGCSVAQYSEVGCRISQ